MAKKPAKTPKPKGADGPALDEGFLASVGGKLRPLKRQAWSTPACKGAREW